MCIIIVIMFFSQYCTGNWIKKTEFINYIHFYLMQYIKGNFIFIFEKKL